MNIEEEKRIIEMFNKYYEDLSEGAKSIISFGKFKKNTISLVKQDDLWNVYLFKRSFLLGSSEDIRYSLSTVLNRALEHYPQDKKLKELSGIIDFSILESVKKSQRERLRTTTEYVNWLQNFTEDRTGFNDTDQCDDSLELYDKAMIKNLDKFFGIIDKWAQKNYISSGGDADQYCYIYDLRYNGIIYEIGLMVGQGSFLWAKRVENANTEIIDFEEIMNDTLRSSAFEIESQLLQFENTINSLRDNGISTEFIEQRFKKTLENYRGGRNQSDNHLNNLVRKQIK